MTTIATTHSGGEGVGVGAKAAGIAHLWGIEYRADIAGVAATNGFHSIVSAVELVDPHKLESPDVLHSSPVCKRASVANAKRGEIREDVESGEVIANFIRVLRPKVFTLENVYGYRKFEAFKIICDTLTTLGYAWDVTHLNAADFGVPQTRKRLVLRATRYKRKVLPPYPAKEKWVGWYAAIEDLIPTLPESRFAPWQLKRLPEELRETFYAGQGNRSMPFPCDSPADTLTANHNQANMRAFIASGALNDRSTSLSTRSGDDPMLTVTGSHNNRDIRAFIVPGANSSNEHPERYADEPAATLTAHQKQVMTTRAFIVNTREMHDYREENPVTVRDADEPLYTLSATSGASRHKAFLHGNGTRSSPTDAEEPSDTVTSNSNQTGVRAWLSCGRVVKMTTRALARFQSVPDWYVLPPKNELACTIIGNMVAPLFYEKIGRQLAETL